VGRHSLKKLISQDDALDVFGVHASGYHRRAADRNLQRAQPGRTGHHQLGDDETDEYPGILDQFIIQAKAVGLVFVWTAVVAFIAFKVADLIVGLRVAEEEEREGLDTTYHARLHTTSDRMSAEAAVPTNAALFSPGPLGPVFLSALGRCYDCTIQVRARSFRGPRWQEARCGASPKRPEGLNATRRLSGMALA